MVLGMVSETFVLSDANYESVSSAAQSFQSWIATKGGSATISGLKSYQARVGHEIAFGRSPAKHEITITAHWPQRSHWDVQPRINALKGTHR